MKFDTWNRALTLSTLIAVSSVGLVAQTYHHYKLVDLGTLGGPMSLISGPGTHVLNNKGTIVAYADTAQANPNPGCFISFNANAGGGDCFVEQPIIWRNGIVNDLGVLPRGTNGQTVSISNNGLIVGYSEDGRIDPRLGLPEGHAVLWAHGGIIDLGALPGGYESLATGNNDRGQVVGFSGNNTIEDPSLSLVGLPTETRAFLWQNGQMRDLGTLGGTDALAFFVNEQGQVAGFSYTNSDATLNPFFWQNGKMTDIGSLGGTFGISNWLNSQGQVVGYSNLAGDATHHGFLWSHGKLQDLGTLGGDNSEANWISDSGFITGRADVPGSQSHHAFRWKNGEMTDLGNLQSWPCSTALNVNTEGEVVGETGICGVGGGPAFISSHGQPIVDLNSLIAPASDLQVVSAFDINERGEIAGIGVLPNGEPRAVLLIPCDQEHSGVEGCDFSTANPRSAETQYATPRFLQNGTKASHRAWLNKK